MQEQKESSSQTETVGVHIETLCKDIQKCYIQELWSDSFCVLERRDSLVLIHHNLTSSTFSVQKHFNFKIKHKLPSALLPRITCSYRHKCMFMLLETGDIAIYNHSMKLLGKAQMLSKQVKHCLDYHYADNFVQKFAGKDYFLFLFTQELLIVTVEFVGKHNDRFKIPFNLISVQTTKYALPISFVEKVEVAHDWKQAKQMVILRNTSQVLILALQFQQSKLVPLIQQRFLGCVGSSINKINSIKLNLDRKHIYVATANGQLKVYSFLTKPKEVKPIAVIETHERKPVIEMNYLDGNKVVVMLKGHIQIYDMNSFIVIGRYCTCDFTSVFFVTGDKFLGRAIQSLGPEQDELKSYNLVIGSYSHKHSILYDHRSTLWHSLQQPNNHLFILSDHSLLFLEKQPQKIHHFFTPPHCLAVLSMVRNPYYVSNDAIEEQEYWLLTERSTLYKYVYSTVSNNGNGKSDMNISGIVQLGQFVDIFNVINNYEVTSLTFIRYNLPVIFDCDIQLKKYVSVDGTVEKVAPVCFGTKTGELLLAKISNVSQMTQLIAKIRCIEVPIFDFFEQTVAFSDYSLLVQYFQETSQIGVTKIVSNKPPINVYKSALPKGSWVKKMTEKFFAIVNKADFYLVGCRQAGNNLEMLTENNGSQDKVANKITCIEHESLANSEFILTGDNLGKVALWTVIYKEGEVRIVSSKMLQMSDQNPIECIRWMNSHLICGWGGTIYQLPFDVRHQEALDKIEKKEMVRINNRSLDQFLEPTKIRKLNRKKVKQLSEVFYGLPDIKQQSNQILDANKDPFMITQKRFRSNHTEFEIVTKFPALDSSRIRNGVHSPLGSALTARKEPRKFRTKSNRGAQHLFHFPNSNVYDELITRNIIQ